MIDFIERLVGPYPFDGYGSVLVDDPELYHALETRRCRLLQSSWVDEVTVVHELAHQWFGDAVTVAEWRDLWLAEGFATYFEYLWEHRGDQAGFDEALDGFTTPSCEHVGPAVVSRPQDLFADNTYYRGALTLEALRRTVGDEASRQTVRRWYRTYRNGNATSADFIRSPPTSAARVCARCSTPGSTRSRCRHSPASPALSAQASKARRLPTQLGIGVRRRPLSSQARRRRVRSRAGRGGRCPGSAGSDTRTRSARR